MATNLSFSGLNRGISSNVWWPRIANHVKFTEAFLMSTEKAKFCQKYLQRSQTSVCLYKPASKRQTIEKNLTDLPVKKNSGHSAE